NIGVIGCGYWGPNLIRNFVFNEKTDVVSVCDLRKERLDFIKRVYPFVDITDKSEEVTSDNRIDAIAISTPPSTHYVLAKSALENGKHVLIEKPMTVSSEEGEELIEIAEKNNKILMVDHTYVFTTAVRKIKEIYDSGEIGDVLYYDSVRINLGLFQQDINVIWDLAPHDLSIMNYILQKDYKKVSAIGVSHANPEIENIAYMTVHFDENLIAHFHLNWLAPVKIRLTLIGGSKKMIVYDDMEPTDKVKVYDKGIEIRNIPEEVYNILISYRTGDIYIPKIENIEALKIETDHFAHCVETGEKPVTDGEFGLTVVKILEAAQRSIKNGGRIEEIK
ncbi:gfo/Idh/MocA family oxidoreductase, partial [candidate division KSB1 bacterium]